MTRWKRVDEDLWALRDEARAEMEVVYFAATLGAVDAGRTGRALLAGLAARMGVEEPPSLEELVADPDVINVWAVRAGLPARGSD